MSTRNKKPAIPADIKSRLTPEQYRIAFEEGTERAFTPGNYNDEKREGVYRCVACGTVLWSSQHKYDSGSGWPSFWRPADDAPIGTSTDYKLIAPRTEVHCDNCGAHMGHVFPDGPQPTGLRYCINGAVLSFEPSTKGEEKS
ncbi:peptide-methionine (R)-S-oxide reductase MsrB [bacterium]|nr:peptide-methionine (R)-S-oxide reductase MsrB [bacterium]